MFMKISFDSKGDFNVIRSWLDKVTKRNPSKTLGRIASQGTTNLKNNTPRDTGETASSWVTEITTKGNISEIAWKNTAHPDAEVNVAKLIELGHGTGNGGYVPPKPYIKKSMDPVFKDVGDRVVKELIRE